MHTTRWIFAGHVTFPYMLLDVHVWMAAVLRFIAATKPEMDRRGGVVSWISDEAAPSASMPGGAGTSLEASPGGHR